MRGEKMLPLSGARFVSGRWTQRDGGELPRYLTAEYGRGTGLGFLNGLTASGTRSRRKMNGRCIQRLRGLIEEVKTRVAHPPAADLQQDRSLPAQRNRG